MNTVDIFIIGGGINGAAIAADAAGRGLSVVLCEKGDLASATSSASTKLIHGGLRYLELYEFGLVRDALEEREILMKKAPHLITPLKFILPHKKYLRPAWLMRVALFLYDHLTEENSLPFSKSINLKKEIYGKSLNDTFSKGFSYYDCFTDDARLTILNALAARNNGANILTRYEFLSAHSHKKKWKIEFKNTFTGKIYHLFSKVLINASGAWVNEIQKKIDPKKIIPYKLVKGSHIVVPKLFEGDFAYILQNKDKRVVFAIPYQDDWTLIGTTDLNFSGNLCDKIKITPDEENYLCEIINKYFKKSISVKDIIWSYSGVRCLQDEDKKNLSEISRNYKIYLDRENHPPLLTIVGGKITTHRHLAEEAVNLLKPFISGLKAPWTASSPLPSGDFPNRDFEEFLREFKYRFPWLPEKILNRYARNYGTHSYLILKNVKNMQDLGEDFTNGLYEKELEYLTRYEWALTVDDIIWRRTKMGLVLSEAAKRQISEWIERCWVLKVILSS
ncbi:MAG TPA: glycerol-3-phosphate dehydrogenase [Gammaproteobacteria bacterium]|nr:glycerol-3-phosphate dehydrogenase [Gammaproteobacteria bacterium]